MLKMHNILKKDYKTLLKNSSTTLSLITNEFDCSNKCKQETECSAISYNSISKEKCFLFKKIDIKKYSKDENWISIFKLILSEFNQKKNLPETIALSLIIVPFSVFLLILINFIIIFK